MVWPLFWRPAKNILQVLLKRVGADSGLFKLTVTLAPCCVEFGGLLLGQGAVCISAVFCHDLPLHAENLFESVYNFHQISLALHNTVNIFVCSR